MILLLAIAAHITASNAWIHDGDSLHVTGITQEIRLLGVDAPELHQTCQDKDNKPYACGIESRAFLASLIGAGRVVTCQGSKTDLYGRLLATCYANGLNLNEEMVRNGEAVSYMGHSYDAQELDAKVNSRGIWRGSFELPSEYRHGKITILGQ